MSVAEKIHAHVLSLPEPLQVEVLDFIEFLMTKTELEFPEPTSQEWSHFSLAMAMRGMEDDADEPEYSLSDLKETF